MPTRNGYLVLLAGLLLGGFAWLIGGIEFYAPAIAAGISVTVALLMRYMFPSRLQITKLVSPKYVPVGGTVLVEIDVYNDKPRRTPLLRLHDAVEGTTGFTVNIAPLAAKTGFASTSYQLSIESRGVYELGPMNIFDVDPLGLTQRKHKVVGTIPLVVHPHIEPVPPLTVRSISEPTLGQPDRESLGLQDEEFNGLRLYTTGDDLRRIHWLSSARQDELQVRQVVPPQHALLNLIIDTRPPCHLVKSLDVTTSIAASIATAVLSTHDGVIIQTTDGRSSAQMYGTAQLFSAYHFLACLANGASEIHPTISSGITIAISANPELTTDAASRGALTQRLNSQLLITVDAKNWGSSSGYQLSPNWIHLNGANQLAKVLAARSQQSDYRVQQRA